VHRLGQSVATGIVNILLHEGSKESIENNQNTTVVTIDIAIVRSMVCPMVRGCIENPFENAKFGQQFGVHPELIQQI
jgi:hypothetical protein